MDRQEANRRSAQYALFNALRRVYPVPLVELRDGLPPSIPAAQEAFRPARSADRISRIRAAQRRVKALPPTTVLADQSTTARDLDSWAASWKLQGLRDLAPHLIAYWSRRPAAAKIFHFPKVRPLAPTPKADPSLEWHDPAQPLLAMPEHGESRAEFIARANVHFSKRKKGVRQPRELALHAKWFVRFHVQGWSVNQVAESETTAKKAPDVSTIRKAIREFVKLLSRNQEP